VAVELTGPLNSQHFVVDFFEVKTSIMEIIDGLDHALLLPAESQEINIVKEEGQVKVDFNQKHYEFPETDVRLLPIEATTAELLAKYIHDQLKNKFADYLLKVELGETEGSIAIYSE
jgi:6-pyruvoyltetrahydropterin/6-carboxytetrahydropterin synthase